MTPSPTIVQQPSMLSNLAENLIGSEIIKLSGEVNALIAKGEKVYNLTIGDFNPHIFPIPQELSTAITDCYRRGETNYPAAGGMPVLCSTLSKHIERTQQLSYMPSDILVSGGARPLIYALYQSVVNTDETVLFPAPSWNNNHYSYLTQAQQIVVETKAENRFMPTLADIEPHLSSAALIALCSPLNPTGTTLSRNNLEGICAAVVAENKTRTLLGKKPVYVMYDQIYSALTYNNVEHLDPVRINPAMREYTLFIDGISKSLSATGVRVGWAFGPSRLVDRMKNILSHIGAWAPKPEQLGVAEYLQNTDAYDTYIHHQRQELLFRLQGFYHGFMSLKQEGYAVDAIAPEAALYLTVQFALVGKVTPEGKTLENTSDITAYLLNVGKVALVPFSAFSASLSSTWFRLSVGTCTRDDVEGIVQSICNAVKQLR